MKVGIKTSIILTLALFGSTTFSGCGGGGGSSGPSIGTKSSFSFTSPSSNEIFTNERVAIDIDATEPSGAKVSYAISGTDASKFSIDKDGVVIFNEEPLVGSYTFVVTATSNAKDITQTVTITVATAPNHAPTITSATSASVNENQSSAINIVANDEDGDNLLYSITGGTDKDAVKIDTTGKVTFKVAPDFETKTIYHFTVNVSDDIDNDSQDITINIKDVDEGTAPLIRTSSTIRVNEGSKKAFTIDATDSDGDTITYSLEGGADDSDFTVVATSGVVRFKNNSDYETKNSYTLLVGASDATATTTKEITLSLIDIDGKSKLVKTGQNNSFVSGDDGDTRIGVARKFKHIDTRHKVYIYILGQKIFTGTRITHYVTQDETTGLEWKDNQPQHGTYNQAVKYCQDLDYNNQKDWRLPTVLDFYTLTNRGASNPAKYSEFRTTKTNAYHWTSTPYFRSDNIHYTFGFDRGNDFTAKDSDKRYYSCVRSKRNYAGYTILDPSIYYEPMRLVRSSYNPIVTDWAVLNIAWADEKIPAKVTWENAIGACKGLTLGGYSDWRLPNINELLTLVDHQKTNGSAFFNVFHYKNSGKYFSSTTFHKDVANAWTVNFGDGGDDTITSKTSKQYYRCVRTLGD